MIRDIEDEGMLIFQSSIPPTEQEKCVTAMRSNIDVLSEIQENIKNVLFLYCQKYEEIGILSMDLENLYEDVNGFKLDYKLFEFENLVTFLKATSGRVYNLCHIGRELMILPVTRHSIGFEIPLQAPTRSTVEMLKTMNPRDMAGSTARFYELDFANLLKMNTMIDITIAGIVNPSHFYFQISMLKKHFNDFMYHIQYFYDGNVMENRIPLVALRPGQLCAVLYGEILGDQEAWYRGRIVKRNTDKIMTVELVDFGRIINVRSVRLRYLHIYLASFPVQAIPSSLVGIRPTGRRWTKEATDRFKQFAQMNKNLVVRVLSPDFECPEIPVVMFDSNGSEYSINKLLIDEFHARLLPNFPHIVLQKNSIAFPNLNVKEDTQEPLGRRNLKEFGVANTPNSAENQPSCNPGAEDADPPKCMDELARGHNGVPLADEHEEKPEDKPEEKPEDEHTDKPEEKPEDKPEDEHKDKPEDEHKDKPEEKPEEEQEEKPKEEQEVKPEGKPEDELHLRDILAEIDEEKMHKDEEVMAEMLEARDCDSDDDKSCDEMERVVEAGMSSKSTQRKDSKKKNNMIAPGPLPFELYASNESRITVDAEARRRAAAEQDMGYFNRPLENMEDMEDIENGGYGGSIRYVALVGNFGNMGDMEGEEDVGNVGHMANMENIGNMRNMGNMDDMEDVGDVGNMGNMDNMEDVGDVGNMGNMDNMEDVGDVGNVGHVGNVGNIGNMGNMDNMEDVGDVGNVGHVGNVGNIGNMGNMDNMEDVGDVGNVGHMGNVGNIGNMGNMDNMEDVGDVGNVGHMGNVGNIGNMGNMDNMEDVGDVGNVGHMGNIENLRNMGNLEDMVHVGNMNDMEDIGNVGHRANMGNIENMVQVGNVDRMEQPREIGMAGMLGIIARMERIDRMERMERLRNMGIMGRMGHMGNIENIRNMVNIVNRGNMRNIENVRNMENIVNMVNRGDMEIVGNLGNLSSEESSSVDEADIDTNFMDDYGTGFEQYDICGFSDDEKNEESSGRDDTDEIPPPPEFDRNDLTTTTLLSKTVKGRVEHALNTEILTTGPKNFHANLHYRAKERETWETITDKETVERDRWTPMVNEGIKGRSRWNVIKDSTGTARWVLTVDPEIRGPDRWNVVINPELRKQRRGWNPFLNPVGKRGDIWNPIANTTILETEKSNQTEDQPGNDVCTQTEPPIKPDESISLLEPNEDEIKKNINNLTMLFMTWNPIIQEICLEDPDRGLKLSTLWAEHFILEENESLPDPKVFNPLARDTGTNSALENPLLNKISAFLPPNAYENFVAIGNKVFPPDLSVYTRSFDVKCDSEAGKPSDNGAAGNINSLSSARGRECSDTADITMTLNDNPGVDPQRRLERPERDFYQREIRVKLTSEYNYGKILQGIIIGQRQLYCDERVVHLFTLFKNHRVVKLLKKHKTVYIKYIVRSREEEEFLKELMGRNSKYLATSMVKHQD